MRTLYFVLRQANELAGERERERGGKWEMVRYVVLDLLFVVSGAASAHAALSLSVGKSRRRCE